MALPNERETRICCFAAGASSTSDISRHEVPRSSSKVFSSTTLNFLRMAAASARTKSSTVSIPDSPSFALIRLPMSQTLPTSVASSTASGSAGVRVSKSQTCARRGGDEPGLRSGVLPTWLASLGPVNKPDQLDIERHSFGP